MEDLKQNKEMISKSKILFVEGRDEVLFFSALSKKIGLHSEIQVIDFQGKANMKNFISMASKTEGFIETAMSFAIIRDADKNFKDTATEVSDAIKSIFSIENTKNGEMIQGKNIKAGFFIMPGNEMTGELEDLVLSSFKGNKVSDKIENYLDELKSITKPDDESSPFIFPKKSSKAKIQIYFSSMEESDARMGISAERKYVDFDHASFVDIIKFIQSM